MDFKQLVMREVDSKYQDMAEGKTEKPLAQSPTVFSHNTYEKKRDEYYRRLNCENSEFKKAVKQITVNRNKRLELEETKRLEKERKREQRIAARKKAKKKAGIALLIVLGVVILFLGLYFLAGMPNDTLLVICCVVGLIVGIVVGIVFVNNVFGGGGCLGYLITIGICYFLAALVLVLFMSGIQFVTGNTPTMIGYLSDGSDSGDMYASGIVQKYSGSYSAGRTTGFGTINITSCDKKGKITGTFSFIVDDQYGEYKITGQITSAETGKVVLTIKAGDWIRHPDGYNKLDDMEVIIYNSYKILECVQYNMRWTVTSGNSSSSTNSDSNVLTGITLNINSSVATIGDTIALSFTPTPATPQYAMIGQNDKQGYDPSCIEYYVRINGEDIRINNHETSITYKFDKMGEYVFWAKYCQHSSYSDCGGKYDKYSQEIKVIVGGNSIASPADLLKLANSNEEFELTADIDMSGVDFSSIGGFTGVLDGKGYSIKNLTINSSESNVGLFSTLDGTVKNLKIENATVTVTGRNENIGILCGTLNGVAEDIFTSGTVKADKGTNVGGVVGCVTKLGTYTISDLKNEADVAGKEKVGGIFGAINNTANEADYVVALTSFKNSGKIVASGQYAGGVVGYLYLVSPRDYYSITMNASELTNTGDISGTQYVGGLFGYGETDTAASYLQDCSNQSKVTAESYVGALAGKLVYINIDSCSNSGSSISATGNIVVEGVKYAYVGGYVGCGYLVNNCTNTVPISYKGGGRYVGGVAGCIAGYIPAEGTYGMSNLENTADITGVDYVGGIAGYIAAQGTYEMSNLENTANITGADYVGGIFGAINNTANDTDYTVTFTSFKNSGKIVASGNYAGGVIGYLNMSNGRYYYSISLYATRFTNTGAVSGKQYIGGLFGYAVTDSTKSSVVDYTATGSASANSKYGKRYGDVENLKFE